MHWHLTKNTEGWVASLIDSEVVAMLRGDTLEHVRQRIESYVGYQKANGRDASPVLVSDEPEAQAAVAAGNPVSDQAEPVLSPVGPELVADVPAEAPVVAPDVTEGSAEVVAAPEPAADAVDPTAPAA